MTATSVSGMGRIPRVLAVGLLVLLLIVGYFNFDAVGAAGAGAPVAVAFVIFVRSVMMRTYVLDNSLFIVSWFRTYAFSLLEIEECCAVPYTGLLSRGAEMQGPTGFGLQMLEIELTSGRVQEFPGSLMTTRAARAACEEIQRLLREVQDEQLKR